MYYTQTEEVDRPHPQGGGDKEGKPQRKSPPAAEEAASPQQQQQQQQPSPVATTPVVQQPQHDSSLELMQQSFALAAPREGEGRRREAVTLLPQDYTTAYLQQQQPLPYPPAGQSTQRNMTV